MMYEAQVDPDHSRLKERERARELDGGHRRVEGKGRNVSMISDSR